MRRAATMAAALFLAATSAQAAGPYSKVHVGNWDGGAYTDDATGQFSHCAVSAGYKSGVSVITSVNRSYGWVLGFASEQWKLTPGSKLAVQLQFDRGNLFPVSGDVIGPKLVAISMPDNSDLIAAFRTAHTMVASALNQRYVFDLLSTSRVLPALVECVKANMTFVATPAQPPVPPQPTVLAKPATDPNLQVEVMTMATNFLLASQIPGARVLKPGEGPDVGNAGAAWTASGAAGQVRIVPPQKDQKGIDVAAGIVAADARECGGKFASGRSSELVDSDVVFRGFSSCEDSNGRRYAEYYVVPRKAGGFAVFSVNAMPGKGASAEANPVEEKRTAFQKAALQAAD